MSNVVQIKRGSGKPDGKLAPYELGFDTKDNTLYIGGKKKTNDEDEEIYGDALQIRVEWAKQAEQANCLTQNALEQVANAEIVVQRATQAANANYADYAVEASSAETARRALDADEAGSATYARYKTGGKLEDNNSLIAKSELLNLIYPIGSIYISVNQANPSTLFGGTWERIEDRFLLAAGSTYAAGTIGGDKEHAHTYGLVVGEHYRDVSLFDMREKNTRTGVLDPDGNPVGWEDTGTNSVLQSNYNSLNSTNYLNVSQNTYKSVAETTSSSNLPPYLAVYMWKRTA